MQNKVESINSTNRYTQLSNITLDNLSADNIPVINTKSEMPNSFNFTIEEKIILGKKHQIQKNTKCEAIELNLPMLILTTITNSKFIDYGSMVDSNKKKQSLEDDESLESDTSIKSTEQQDTDTNGSLLLRIESPVKSSYHLAL
jgi:hypothetical protein